MNHIPVNILRCTLLLLFASASLFFSRAQILRGNIIDEKNSPVEGAHIELVNAALSTTSGSHGIWSIAIPLRTGNSLLRRLLPVAIQKGRTLHFVVSEDNLPVTVSMYTLGGRFMYHAVNRKLPAGLYRCDPLSGHTGANIYAVRLRIGETVSCFSIPVIDGTDRYARTLQGDGKPVAADRLEKRTVVIDTIKVTKSGFIPAAQPLHMPVNPFFHTFFDLAIPRP